MTGHDAVVGGARVVTPEGVLPRGWVEVSAGRIAAVGADPAEATTGAPTDHLPGGWLVPGFVDLHMHGGGGHDVDASLDDMRAAVEFHRTAGTTRTLVSLMTAPVDRLVEQLGWAAELTEQGVITGAHLEGPFLAADRSGAQNRAHLRAPDPDLTTRLLKAGRGALRTVTLAPELPGALDLVRDLVADGVVAAVGHTDATYDEARAAFDAGATVATHLFNAMGPIRHRAPGTAIAALDAAAGGGVTVEVINDGVHLHDALTRIVSRAAPGRMAFVTDAISATGMADGAYRLGGLDVEVRAGQARLAGNGALAGSTLTMAEAFRRAVQVVGMPVEAAVDATATTPARVLGLDDAGAILPGRAADLVWLDDDLTVRRVMVGGRWT
jgi:N-acetylglucosamine-6-phosphate deacetylase